MENETRRRERILWTPPIVHILERMVRLGQENGDDKWVVRLQEKQSMSLSCGHQPIQDLSLISLVFQFWAETHPAQPSAFTPPTTPLEYLRGRIDETGLSSTRQVHHGACVACVANLLPKTLANLVIWNLTTFRSIHPSRSIWTSRTEIFTERMETIMPSLETIFARRRKVRCVGDARHPHRHCQPSSRDLNALFLR